MLGLISEIENMNEYLLCEHLCCILIIPGELLDLDVLGFGLVPLLFLSLCFFSGDGVFDSVFTQINIELSERFAFVVLPAAVTSLASTLLKEVSFF